VAGDVYFGSVSLLLHCDGVNGSTTFTDSSQTPKTVTAVGSAQVSTTQSKWDGASARFVSAGSALIVPSSTDFDILSGDFTVEMWVYYPSNPTTAYGFALIARDSDLSGWQLRIKNGGGGFEWVYPGLAAAGPSASMAVNTWHHLAICRQGTQHYGSINGVVTSFALSNRTSNLAVQLSVGAGNYLPSVNGVYNGYIDDLRITKGVARYTSNFTPPTQAFANSAEVAAVSGYVAAPTPLGAPTAQAVVGNNFYAHAAAPSPLGAPQVLAQWLQSARAAAPGPLGTPPVLAAALVAAYGSAPSMLGVGAATVYLPLGARISCPSPLGAPQALALHDFTGQLGDTITRYVMDLLTPTGTARVPISSWQATLQTGSSNYVQCVVPACSPWVDALNTATEFVICRRADVPGTALSIEYEMARSATEQARYNQGPQRYTCTLSGYPDAFASSIDPPVAYDRQLTGVRSISSGSGLRVRCAIDWLLRPGHRAYVGAVPFVVRFINYYALESDGYMDVGE
jgi:hypothetical protein